MPTIIAMLLTKHLTQPNTISGPKIRQSKHKKHSQLLCISNNPHVHHKSRCQKSVTSSLKWRHSLPRNLKIFLQHETINYVIIHRSSISTVVVTWHGWKIPIILLTVVGPHCQLLGILSHLFTVLLPYDVISKTKWRFLHHPGIVETNRNIHWILRHLLYKYILLTFL